MKTLILENIIKVLIPLFIAFGVYMFFRGHDQPGGGFIAGLIVSIPFMLHAISFGAAATYHTYRIKPVFVAGAGLFLALISGLMATWASKPFLTGLWAKAKIPFIEKVGTPVLFDLGVMMVVFGVVMQVTFLFAGDEAEENPQ